MWILISLISLVSCFSSSRIQVVGGREVSLAFRYPFLVSLIKSGQHRCGGTLITNSVVITAAHCSNIADINEFQALVHRHNFNQSESTERAKRYSVIERTNHPKFDSETLINDISIWRINCTEPSSPKILWRPSSYRIKPLLTIVGWGATSSGSISSSILRQVDVPLYNMKQCLKDYPMDEINPQLQFCAGYPEGGRDACQGDSGGPLIGWQNDNIPVLIGIVSWGNGCADPHQPGIYTKVSAYRRWIQSLI